MLWKISSLKGENFSGQSVVILQRSLNWLRDLELALYRIAQQMLSRLQKNKSKVTNIQKELVTPLVESEYGLEAEVIHLILLLLTVQGKVLLQVRGGDKIDLNNVREKLKTLAPFENIAYAKLQEGQSWDFAERLLNHLGLQGGKMKIEKERMEAFRAYREKLVGINCSKETLEKMIKGLENKNKHDLPLTELKDRLDKIKELDWKNLSIPNHSQFGKVEQKI